VHSENPTSARFGKVRSVDEKAFRHCVEETSSNVTAWQAFFDQGQLKAGQMVVIHGAAGNVGAYAVQLARRAGVRTIATAATDDIPFCATLVQTQ